MSGGTVGQHTTTPGASTNVPGISSSTVGTGATIGVGRIASTGMSFAALVQALRSDGSSNIISTPSLVTMNNEEAEVKVTQEIPLITGSFANTTASVSGTTSPFQTIQREEVGTILKVTPHINEGNSVQLKIEQEDSSPGAKLTDSADISTNKRSIKTTVLIEDGGIIVLGGLISDTVTESEDRVPGLGAIPHHRQSVQVAQRFKAEEEPDGVHSSEDPARRRCHRKQQRSRYNEVRQSQRTLNGGHITLLPGQKQPAVPAIPSGHRTAAAAAAVGDAIREGATPSPPAPPPALAAPAAADARRPARRSNERGTQDGRTAAQAVVSIREAPWHSGARHRRRGGRHGMPPRRDAAKPWPRCAASSAFP